MLDEFSWSGLSSQEQSYRAAKLRDIEARVRRDGPHHARAHADRARQFMPFSALKGYSELAHSKELTEEGAEGPAL